MAVEFDAQFDNLDELARKFRRSPGLFERYMQKFFRQILPLLERRVKVKIKDKGAINTGAFRSSIAHEVRGTGRSMQGVVGSPVSYAPFVELDTRPHYPPYEPIAYWLRRKFRLSGAFLRAATRYMQRRIARYGTRGKHVFEETFDESQADISDVWGATWGEAVEQEL